MRFHWLPTRNTVQRLAALMVVLWWGGLNCITGCLIAPSSAATESHCSMSAEGDCCQTEASGEDAPSSASIGAHSTSSQPLVCCSLEGVSAEVNRNAPFVEGVVVTAVLSRVDFTPESEPRAQLPDRWARLPDRGSTHLLNCVFLI